MNSVRLTTGALVAAAALGVAAQELPLRDNAADSINFSKEPFKESAIRLPEAPKPGDLIRFEMGPTRRGFEHFVDGATLNLGEDGVIRYTLVVNSDMGATNVTYEGIRCVTRERKTYAYGRRDGAWVEARDPEWKKIGTPALEGANFVLYTEYFCPGRSAVGSADEAVAALRNGGHPRASHDTPSRLMPLGQ